MTGESGSSSDVMVTSFIIPADGMQEGHYDELATVKGE